VSNKLSYLIFGLSFFFLAGCSVKEDRAGCPCYLKIHFQQDLKGEVTLTVKGKMNPYYKRATFITSDYPEGYLLTLPKDRYDISCIGGQTHCQLDSSEVVIPSGKNYDKIFAWLDLDVACLRENCSDTVILHKQYCQVNINLAHSDTMKTYPYMLEAQGSYVGLEINFLNPIPGAFRCTPSEPSAFSRTIILPRQGEGNLTLKFTDKTTGKTYPLDLHSIFRQKGYNWNATDLKDVEMTIDFASPQMGIVINDWTEILMNYEI
jgi:hypothetical protein